MSTTTSDKNTATVLNNGPVYYTEITGSAFEHVINDDGSEYKFNPAWKCTGFADSTNSRIPKRDPGSVSIFVSRVVFRGAANHGCPSCYRGLKINDQRLRGTLSRRHKCA